MLNCPNFIKQLNIDCAMMMMTLPPSSSYIFNILIKSEKEKFEIKILSFVKLILVQFENYFTLAPV